MAICISQSEMFIEARLPVSKPCTYQRQFANTLCWVPKQPQTTDVFPRFGTDLCGCCCFWWVDVVRVVVVVAVFLAFWVFVRDGWCAAAVARREDSLVPAFDGGLPAEGRAGCSGTAGVTMSRHGGARDCSSCFTAGGTCVCTCCPSPWCDDDDAVVVGKSFPRSAPFLNWSTCSTKSRMLSFGVPRSCER
jgi:hypothetical protein